IATTVLKLAEPTAAKPGTAMTAIASATVAMREKLLMRVIGILLLGSGLEPVAEVQADEICVSVVRAVEVCLRCAETGGAACLEVKCKLRGVEHPRTVVPSDAERRAFAVGVRQQRTDVLG